MKKRSEVDKKDCWNVENMYASHKLWEEAFEKCVESKSAPHWPHLDTFKGTLMSSAAALAKFMHAYFSVERELSKLYTYAHLKHDEDLSCDLYKNAYVSITAKLHQFRQQLSWFEPELLQIPQERLDQFLQSSGLDGYATAISKIVHMKPYMLSSESEALIALAGVSMEVSERAFSAFNNTDLKFPSVADSSGKLHELTHGSYHLHLRSKDRTLRKNAFQTLHNAFQKSENTLSELLNGQVQKHLFNQKARGFSSCVQASLYPHKIDEVVYKNLIETVRSNLPILHAYMKVRKEILGYDELHLYDVHTPLVQAVDFSMEYEEAEHLVIESVSLLGKGYQSDLKRGLMEDRWVDRYENSGKRSGAYSSGCYDSFPYIQMNYHGLLGDVMTLAHEAGHSMHSLLSWRHQSYQDASYPIFVAEVASTFNEELLLRSLLAKESDKKRRAFLINQKIEDIRNCLFRQTMFAEFELKIHTLAERGVPLTPALLKEEYRKLNADYFGPDVIIDPEIDIEWARIPHFYYNFYVYQYATGIAAAHTLVETVLKEGPEKYLAFLSSGGSQGPLELLKIAGVDMQAPQALKAILKNFEDLTSELVSLLR